MLPKVNRQKLVSVLWALLLSIPVAAVYAWIFGSATGWPWPLVLGIVWLLYLWVEFWVKPYKFPGYADFIGRAVDAVIIAVAQFLLVVASAVLGLVVMVLGLAINYLSAREIVAFGPTVFVIWLVTSVVFWWCVCEEEEPEPTQLLVRPDDLPGF
ncbi:MAG: hypothetical protein M1352_02050 [Patescibacteria group bacterium]|nr:hypothetical protein [Patescibacteria group bacterium]